MTDSPTTEELIAGLRTRAHNGRQSAVSASIKGMHREAELFQTSSAEFDVIASRLKALTAENERLEKNAEWYKDRVAFWEDRAKGFEGQAVTVRAEHVALTSRLARVEGAAKTALGSLDDPTGGTHEQDIRQAAGVLRAALSDGSPVERFQQRVQPWMMACFGPEIAADKLERNDRFIEEALELTQASGYTVERAHALVDYVFNRDQGEINQEVGGVMVTLAAHCLAHGVDMHAAGETELARIWTKVEQIRAKQAGKPRGSALPIALSDPEGT